VIARQTSLSANTVAFCRFLRQKGFALSAEEEANALQALEWIDSENRDMFRAALRAVLCRNRSNLEAFDGLFEQYWRALAKAVDSKIVRQERPAAQPGPRRDAFKALKSWLNGHRETEEEKTAYYGLAENLAQRDFSAVPDEELDELMRALRALSRRLAVQLGRRRHATPQHRRLDLRRTLRANLRRGGELLDIAWSKPKRNRAKLVVLCDVSQSMELYTAFLLQFLYAFQQVFNRVETFTFSTDLQRITPMLRERNFDEALQSLASRARGWSGGTKIGHALDTFVQEHARRLLDRRTTVLILSDGLDVGDTGLLSDSLAAIRARCRRIIWLNPLAGYPDYRPDAAGMQAAWPHIDVFGAGHSLEALRTLGRWMR
jgi:uncharacterized protein